MLTTLANGIIDILCFILDGLTLLLPDTPFHFEPVDWGVFGDAIGFVFPVAAMATHMALILSAFGLYYVVRWALRLIRQIQ